MDHPAAAREEQRRLAEQMTLVDEKLKKLRLERQRTLEEEKLRLFERRRTSSEGKLRLEELRLEKLRLFEQRRTQSEGLRLEKLRLFEQRRTQSEGKLRLEELRLEKLRLEKLRSEELRLEKLRLLEESTLSLERLRLKELFLLEELRLLEREEKPFWQSRMYKKKLKSCKDKLKMCKDKGKPSFLEQRTLVEKELRLIQAALDDSEMSELLLHSIHDFAKASRGLKFLIILEDHEIFCLLASSYKHPFSVICPFCQDPIVANNPHLFQTSAYSSSSSSSSPTSASSSSFTPDSATSSLSCLRKWQTARRDLLTNPKLCRAILWTWLRDIKTIRDLQPGSLLEEEFLRLVTSFDIEKLVCTLAEGRIIFKESSLGALHFLHSNRLAFRDFFRDLSWCLSQITDSRQLLDCLQIRIRNSNNQFLDLLPSGTDSQFLDLLLSDTESPPPFLSLEVYLDSIPLSHRLHADRRSKAAGLYHTYYFLLAAVEFTQAAAMVNGSDPSTSQEEDDEDAPPPKKFYLDDYDDIVIKGDLGEGSEGKVFQAEWMCGLLAVKEIRSVRLRSFHLEMNILQRVKHPNIVAMKGYTTKGVSPGCWGLVMELMSDSLEGLIEKQIGKFSPLLSIDILLQVARGMRCLHQSHVMHRDLKPGNVLVQPLPNFLHEAHSQGYMVVKVSDFGISKPTLAAGDEHNDLTYKEGTRYYMAPEIKKNDKAVYTPKADVFSFGTTCLNVATQSCSFDLEFYNLIDKGETQELLSGCAPHFRTLIKHCWAVNPDHRPTFSKICNELETMKRRLLLGLALQEETILSGGHGSVK